MLAVSSNLRKHAHFWQAMLGRQNVTWKRKFKVVQTLLGDWTQKCEVYFHDDQEPVVNDKCKFFRPSQCFINGCCACDAPESTDFQSKLSRYLRSVFSKKDGVAPKERSLLDQRLVFLAFRSLQTGDVRSSVQTENRPEVFLHLGYANLTTWRFTGLKMQPVHWREDGCVTLQIIADSSSPADASLQAQTDLEFCMRSLKLARGCEVSAYVLSDEPSHWQPQEGVNLVPVVMMPDFFLGWMHDDGSGPSRGGGRGKKRKRNEQDMDELQLAQRLLPSAPREPRAKAAAKTAAAPSDAAADDDDASGEAKTAGSDAPVDDDDASGSVITCQSPSPNPSRTPSRRMMRPPTPPASLQQTISVISRKLTKWWTHWMKSPELAKAMASQGQWQLKTWRTRRLPHDKAQKRPILSCMSTRADGTAGIASMHFLKICSMALLTSVPSASSRTAYERSPDCTACKHCCSSHLLLEM